MLLHIDQLNKSYGKHLVLQDVNVQASAPEVLGILGQNGAGKSTFIRCLAQDESFTGSIRFQGEPMAQFLEAQRSFFSLIPDTPKPYSYLKIQDFMRFLIEFRGFRYKDYEAELEVRILDFHLEEHRYKYCREASLGTQKKAFLLPLLVTRPRFVLMDEPTNGLDIESQLKLRMWLKDLRAQGSYIVVTSHNLDFLGKLADRILLLKKGHAAQLLDNVAGDDLESLFLNGMEAPALKA